MLPVLNQDAPIGYFGRCHAASLVGLDWCPMWSGDAVPEMGGLVPFEEAFVLQVEVGLFPALAA